MTEPEAQEILKKFSCVGGVLEPPHDHEVTDEELEAIDYLCDEWDYGYEPRREA